MSLYSKEYIQDFFTLYDAVPNSSPLSIQMYSVMIIAANAHEFPFALFVRPAFDDDKRLVFSSWDELWECYTAFMEGYNG